MGGKDFCTSSSTRDRQAKSYNKKNAAGNCMNIGTKLIRKVMYICFSYPPKYIKENSVIWCVRVIS